MCLEVKRVSESYPLCICNDLSSSAYFKVCGIMYVIMNGLPMLHITMLMTVTESIKD